MGEGLRLGSKMGSVWAHQFYGGRWISRRIWQPVSLEYVSDTPTGQGSDMMLIASDGRDREGRGERKRQKARTLT